MRGERGGARGPGGLGRLQALDTELPGKQTDMCTHTCTHAHTQGTDTHTYTTLTLDANLRAHARARP